MSKIRLQCQTFSSISIKSQVNISRNGKHCNKPKKETKQIPKKKKANNCYKSILNKKRTGKREIQRSDEKRKTYQFQSDGSGTEIWRKHTKLLKLKGYDSDT